MMAGQSSGKEGCLMAQFLMDVLTAVVAGVLVALIVRHLDD